jgi:hypothetical protein
MEATINKADLITVRDYVPGDHSFVMATWLRGLYYGDSWFSAIPKSIFMANYHAALERLLSGPSRVRIACLKDSPDVILGYVVTRKMAIGTEVIDVLDWVFVKAAWRRIGIAKLLVPQTTRACTHLTRSGLAIMKAKMPQVVFNPFIVL